MNTFLRPLLGVIVTSILFSSPNFGQTPETPKSTDETPWISNLRQVTSEGVRSGEGYFSPDGKDVIYQAVLDGCPHYQIYVRSLAGGPPRLISPGKGMTTCAYYHPTDGTVLFASTHLDPSTFPAPPPSQGRYAWNRHASFDIYTCRPDGSELVRLTDAPGYDAEANWSRDGGRIVFTSERDGDAEIYTMRSDGRDVRRVTNAKGYDGGPFFSPDGTKITFRGFRDLRPGMERYSQIYIIDATGRNERVLTFNTAVNWAPYFHPNGKYLAYCTNVGGHSNFELILLRIADAKIVRLTTNEATDIMPVFSPDGSKLMWTTTRYGGASHLVIADFTMPPDDAFGEPMRDDPNAAPSGGRGEHGGERPRGSGGESTSAARSGDGHSHDGHDHGRQKTTATAIVESPEITMAEALGHVKVLSDDEYEGRRPGTRGNEKAASYIESEFKRMGLQPAGAEGYRQTFEVVSAQRRGRNNAATLHRDSKAAQHLLPEEFTPLVFTADAKVDDLPIVFVGYGITSPDGKWDDYAGIDVKGAAVLCFLRGTPDLPKDPNDPHAGLDLYAGARYKAFNAAHHGAKAIIFVADSRQRDKDELTGLAAGSDRSRESLPCVQVRRDIMSTILQGLGADLEKLEVEASKSGRRSTSKLPSITWSCATEVEVVLAKTSNIIGRIKGTAPDAARGTIVFGAHYDHLGHGGPESLAPGGGMGEIHNGADDNASGVSGLIELAEYWASHPLKHDLVFMGFTAEEQGLLGSDQWVKKPTFPLDGVRAMINMDMIGRYGSEGLAIDGVETCKEWRPLIEAAGNGGMKVALTAGSMGGRSDHASFIGATIPSLHFFTGSHEDYHRPTDDWQKINAEGMVAVLDLIKRTVTAMDAWTGRPEFTRPAAPKAQSSGVGYGAYLGTIPSYTQDAGGVRLQGASPGSPAEKAGIQKDDVLVRIGTYSIDNIYDFTNALRSMRPGEEVELEVERGDKKVVLKTTLARR